MCSDQVTTAVASRLVLSGVRLKCDGFAGPTPTPLWPDTWAENMARQSVIFNGRGVCLVSVAQGRGQVFGSGHG